MTALWLRLVALGRSLTPRAWLVIAVLAAFVLVGAYCTHRGAQGERAGRSADELKIERRAGAAREAAGGQRLDDTLTINAREKELSDAVNTLPDARPSPRRVALACQRLRQQGAAERDLPASCRPAG